MTSDTSSPSKSSSSLSFWSVVVFTAILSGVFTLVDPLDMPSPQQMAYYLDMRYWPLWYTPVLWLIAAWLLFDIVAKWGLLSIRYVVSVKILLALTIVGLVILNKGWHHLAMAGLSAGWDWICRADYSLLSDYRESGTLGWRFFLVPLLGIGIILVLLQLRRRKPQKDNVKNEE